MAHDFGLQAPVHGPLVKLHIVVWVVGETNHSPCNPGSKSKQPNQLEPKILFERPSDPNTSREALPGILPTISQDGCNRSNFYHSGLKSTHPNQISLSKQLRPRGSQTTDISQSAWGRTSNDSLFSEKHPPAERVLPNCVSHDGEDSGALWGLKVLPTVSCWQRKVGFLLMEPLISQLHSGSHNQEYLDCTNCP